MCEMNTNSTVTVVINANKICITTISTSKVHLRGWGTYMHG